MEFVFKPFLFSTVCLKWGSNLFFDVMYKCHVPKRRKTRCLHRHNRPLIFRRDFSVSRLRLRKFISSNYTIDTFKPTPNIWWTFIICCMFRPNPGNYHETRVSRYFERKVIEYCTILHNVACILNSLCIPNVKCTFTNHPIREK